ncbi:hypothetical protein PR202_gb13402 [Eleusine coracana subsp. coracana]|uniref:BPM/SPOP BACK domain-containing protein n=1 Tax=Eleusine coracana subsp. coracana TaxID=191504 RepID=A0AAV5EQB7_ELECO|nr:hypothetical protein PR202_gb13402 [Eleusine coracana subsp. coracana]
MAQHLLVAVDRYSLDRLKLLCEDELCRHVDMTTVATTLALADQHNCLGLKSHVFRFLRPYDNMKATMATDGLKHLTSNCPPLVKELIGVAVAQPYCWPMFQRDQSSMGVADSIGFLVSFFFMESNVFYSKYFEKNIVDRTDFDKICLDFIGMLVTK